MKLYNLVISGGLKRPNGDDAQVGDTVRLYLDTVANPDFPETINGIIEHPISKINCGQDRAYVIEYNEEFTIRICDILDSEIVDGLSLLEERVTILENSESDVVLDTRPWPKSGEMFWFGDSQTYGTNSATRPYTSAGRVKEGFRFPDIVFATSGLSTLNNLAVPSSRISWNPSSVTSSFNKMGELGFDPVEGVIATMSGWNNLAQDGDPWLPDSQKFFMNAKMAENARGLIDDWGGITIYGWDKEGTTVNTTDPSPTPGWTTNGANDSTHGTVAIPFPAPSLTTRYWINLDATQYVEFDVSSGIRAVGLFFETSAEGGDFEVLVNGNVVGEYSSRYVSPLDDYFPGVVWLENPSQGDTIRLRCVNGRQHWLAFGTVSDSINLYSKLIICGSPTANPANGRTDIYLQGSLTATKQAVGVFTRNYPVLFVDNQIKWVTNRDQEPTDISHITDIGNAVIANQFQNPYTPQVSESAYFIRL